MNRNMGLFGKWPERQTTTHRPDTLLSLKRKVPVEPSPPVDMVIINEKSVLSCEKVVC